MPTQSGMAVVRVVGRDASGNAGAGGASYVTSAAPYLKLTSPDGHESWEIGSTRTISWAHNLGTNVCLRVDLSRNSGLTWQTLVRSACSQTETMGTYSWQVAGPSTRRARIRVLWSGHAIKDGSDADFAIVKPSVSPN